MLKSSINSELKSPPLSSENSVIKTVPAIGTGGISSSVIVTVCVLCDITRPDTALVSVIVKITVSSSVSASSLISKEIFWEPSAVKLNEAVFKVKSPPSAVPEEATLTSIWLPE